MELPDLDLSPLTPPPPVALPRPTPPASSATSSVMAAVSADFDPFDDADDHEEHMALELETIEEPRERRPPASGPRALTVPASNAGASPARSISGTVRLEEAPIELDPFEVLAFADYGPIPTKIWESPAYAVRVVLRRQQLKGETEDVRAEHGQLEKAWFDSLVALVEKTRPALEAHPDGGRWLSPIVEIEDRARARGDALESTSSEFSAKVAEIDREIAVAEEACAVEATKLEPLAEELERRQSELSRAEAMLKRIDIEIRAAKQAARAAAGPDATVAPPEHAQKLGALAAERDARNEDAVRAKGDFEEVRRPYSAQERAIAERRRHIDELRKRRRSLEETYGRQLSIRSEGVAEAEREKSQVSVDIGKRLLSEAPVPVEASARAAAEAAHRALVASRKELEKHVRAMDAFERDHLKRGLVIIGAGAALVLLLVLWLALRGDSPPV